MDFTSLRYFHETARTGSIRRASELLHVAASSISRSISALEHDLGAPLFERTQKGMRLTTAGVVLARETGRIFRDIDRVRSAINDLQGLRRGRVTLYALEGLIADFLPGTIAAFQAHYPEIQFDVRFVSTDEIVEAIVDDVADIGVTFNGPQRADLAIVFEHVAPLCCLVAPDHPLAGKTEVELSELRSYPMALPETSFGMRRMIDDAFFAVKLRPLQALNTNSLELAKRLTMTGRAIAFMPRFMVRSDEALGRLVALPVASPHFDGARVSVCVHRDRELSFASKAFLSKLTEQFEALRGQDM